MQDLSQPDITNEDVKASESQIARISRMEEILDKSGKAVRDLQEALDRYVALEEEIRELELYYTGGQWQKDFTDDGAGRLPRNLRRGVLSEDAVYDFLALRDEVLGKIRKSFPKKAD
jgi:hypothetical protein